MRGREKAATPGVWGDRLPDVFAVPPARHLRLGEPRQRVRVAACRAAGRCRTSRRCSCRRPGRTSQTWSRTWRAFYEYHAFLTEPWDGPAAIAATDGSSLLAGMDRNGLRPARWAITPDVLLVASEAGVCPEEESKAIATGQLGPGEMILFDGETGQVLHSEEVKAALATPGPTGIG